MKKLITFPDETTYTLQLTYGDDILIEEDSFPAVLCNEIFDGIQLVAKLVTIQVFVTFNKTYVINISPVS